MNATNDDDGGPAFPLPMTFNPHGQPTTTGMYFPDANGMTLRDWFAGAAMKGYLSSDPLMPDVKAARWSYDMADAMLAARKEQA